MAPASTSSFGQYLIKQKTFEARTVDVPIPALNEVQIIPRSITLCGSDLHYYNHYRNGSITVREPLCLGHECAGQVVGVGDGVTDVKIGDKVAIECGVPCSACDLCHEGRYNLCSKLRFRSSGSAFPHFQGTLQHRINHPAKWTHILPDELTFDDGALLEPLAVACHAVRRAGLNSGSTCLIIGAGAVGLLCAAVARSRGCSRIVISDIDRRRVDFAVQQGFAEVGRTTMPRKFPDTLAELANARQVANDLSDMKWPDGGLVGRPHISLECTGVPSCVQSTIYATRSGGKIMMVGMGTPNYVLPISEASAREIDLMPTWRYAYCYREAIDIMKKAVNGVARPDIRSLITHRFEGLDNVQEAFATAGLPQDHNGDMVIKVVVRNTPDKTGV